LANRDAARRAEQEVGAEIREIRKTSREYGEEKNPPPCPSVAADGRLIAINDVVSVEALKDALLGSGDEGKA
jgi:hypothetical protein